MSRTTFSLLAVALLVTIPTALAMLARPGLLVLRIERGPTNDTTLTVAGAWPPVRYNGDVVPVLFRVRWAHQGQGAQVRTFSDLADTMTLDRVRGVADTIELCVAAWVDARRYGQRCRSAIYR